MKFLIVDDFSIVRQIVRNLLKELGYTNVDEAEDSAMGLSRLKSRHIGLEYAQHEWAGYAQSNPCR